MSKRWLTSAAVLGAVIFCEAAVAAPVIVEFSAPGNFAQPAIGGIDVKGDIAGSYQDAGVSLGFVRKPTGEVVTFSAGGNDVIVEAAAGRGLITGFANLFRGFVADYREPDQIVYFSVDGADESGFGTQPLAMNAGGTIAGIYGKTTDNVPHAFVRQPGGSIETFDGPLADLETGGTRVWAINKNGDVVGWTTAQGAVEHPFIRRANGRMSTFTLPNQSFSVARENRAYAVNAKQTIGGAFTDENDVVHGYLRDKHGNLTLVDIEDAKQTRVTALNNKGVAAGTYVDQDDVRHGFVRAKDGTIATFDAPHAVQDAGRGTSVNGINEKGWISGFFFTEAGQAHFFLRKP